MSSLRVLVVEDLCPGYPLDTSGRPNVQVIDEVADEKRRQF
jgi:hypothetical protein